MTILLNPDPEEIWHQYSQALSRFLASRAPADVVEDLLQEVFVKILTRLETLQDHKKLESWIYQITRNTLIDYYRTRRTHEEIPEDLANPEAEAAVEVRKELAACLGPMIQALPPTYRRAVQLSEMDGKTQGQVAALEGLTLSGAKSRVQRGRDHLKILLKECCTFEINRHNQVLSYEPRTCKNC
ncbi:MAG: RNA polymerase sigma factor SigZ [Spirochaetales bacterium]|nr:RNA polymerase sigma factor SigZ [Spirochaetales bacterium]